MISRKYSLGYEDALNFGFEYLRNMGYSYLITVDADGEHDTSMIPEFISSLKNGSDLVVGKRTKYNRFSEYFLGWYFAIKWGVDDPICGMKGYKLETVSGCFDSMNLIGVELLYKSLKSQKRISQVIMSNYFKREGLSRFGPSAIKSNLKIMKLLLKIIQLEIKAFFQ